METKNFLNWMEQQISNRSLSALTRKSHLTTLHALQRFGGIQTFGDLTLENIEAFDQFLREEQNFTTTGKLIPRNQAAIHNYHKRLKTYVNIAYRKELIFKDPYLHFTDDRGETEGHHALTRKQVNQLLNLRNHSREAAADAYLDFFLFQLYTGLNYCDASHFNYKQDVVTIAGTSCINGKQLKSGRNTFTPILSEALDILERNHYELHIASNQKYNQFLKGIGFELQRSFPLTSEVARNTFEQVIAHETKC